MMLYNYSALYHPFFYHYHALHLQCFVSPTLLPLWCSTLIVLCITHSTMTMLYTYSALYHPFYNDDALQCFVSPALLPWCFTVLCITLFYHDDALQCFVSPTLLPWCFTVLCITHSTMMMLYSALYHSLYHDDALQCFVSLSSTVMMLIDALHSSFFPFFLQSFL